MKYRFKVFLKQCQLSKGRQTLRYSTFQNCKRKNDCKAVPRQHCSNRQRMRKWLFATSVCVCACLCCSTDATNGRPLFRGAVLAAAAVATCTTLWWPSFVFCALYPTGTRAEEKKERKKEGTERGRYANKHITWHKLHCSGWCRGMPATTVMIYEYINYFYRST